MDAPNSARLSVTRAILRALGRIAATQPVLGRHLGASIRTGTRRAYRPPETPPIALEVGEAE